MTANIISISRIVFSLCLFAFSPSSEMFSLIYLLCGVTDVMDGFLARLLQSESKTGENLDSIADLFFAFAYLIKIIPFLHLPVWIWIWTTVIASLKIFGILKKCKKEKRFFIKHSFANKMTGFFLFLLPMTVSIIEVKYSAAIVCIIANIAAIEELFEK